LGEVLNKGFFMKKKFVFIMLVVGLIFSAVEAFGQDKEQWARNAVGEGLKCIQSGDYEDAIEYFEIAIHYSPNYDMAYYGRGQAYSRLDNYDRAIADYTKAIQLAPNNARYYASRGVAYFAKGDRTRALADANSALKIDPNNAVAKDLSSKLGGNSSQPAAPPAPVYVTQNCTTCDGTGKINCAYCRGTGVLSNGFASMTCSFCHGRKKVDCTTCGGSGKIRVEKR